MISVIIPTLNRAALLDKTLQSLLHQSIPATEFEVLVIDNGSTDSTREVVSQYTSKLNIRYIVELQPGLHQGRHRGLRESTSDILSFADDDIQALPTWLEGIAESFEDSNVGLVGGKNIPDYESPPPAWLNNYWVNTKEGKYMTYFSLLDFGDKVQVVDPLYVFGCNFSIRKSIVLDAKGFHPDGMPQSLIKFRGDGESYVARHVQQMGYATLYNPKASVKHWVPASRMNVQYLEKRAYSEGITQSYVDTRENKGGGSQRSTLRRLLSMLRRRVNAFTESEEEKRIKKSFLAGYQFHQSEISKDKELAAWVMKDTYLQ